MRQRRVMRLISVAGKTLLLIVAIPLALIAALVSTLFGLKEERSAAEVATYLHNYIEGGGGEWDWDDFMSLPIADPQLDDIRLKAIEVTAPDTEEAPTVLRQLLSEAERLAATANGAHRGQG